MIAYKHRLGHYKVEYFSVRVIFTNGSKWDTALKTVVVFSFIHHLLFLCVWLCLIRQEIIWIDPHFHTRVAADVNSFMAMKELISFIIASLWWMM